MHVLIANLLTGAVFAAMLGGFFQIRLAHTADQLRSQHEKEMALFTSQRSWEEQAVSNLLGPMYIQFDRTRRAFRRYTARNSYLEAQVLKEGNVAIRDLLLTHPHLIPPELLSHAGQLVEHYDRWLEEFDRVRGSEAFDQKAEFVFSRAFPFPQESERKFSETFQSMWLKLYGPTGN